MPIDRFIHPRAGHSNKVTSLNDLEFRVWCQYILSADDFGVMRASGLKLQSDNDALAQRPIAEVECALETVIRIGLIHAFEHQGRRFVYQRDWQYWQKVEWPRITHEPKPPADELAKCEETTQALFDKHPGGQRRLRRGGSDPSSSTGLKGVQDSTPVHIPSGTRTAAPTGSVRATPDVVVRSGHVQASTATTRAGARAERLRLTATANGSRPTAEFGEGAETPLPPFDEWLRELQAAYPEQSVTHSRLTEDAFLDVFAGDPRPPGAVFIEILEHLANQKRGYQWCVKRMIPRLDRWLREGLWRQLHDAAPPTALVSERTIQNEISGDAFVKGGGHGTH